VGVALLALLLLAWARPGSAQETPPKAPEAAPAVVAPAVAAKQAPAVTAEPCPPEVERSHRELAGHVFLPSHLIQDPFSYTAFGSNFALGTGQALGPVLDLTTSPPTILAESKWYGYTGLAQGFDLNVRFLEYLSARASLTASAYLGSGRGSILVVGTGVRITGDIGLKGSLPIGEHVRLALSVDARYGPTLNVLLAQSIADALARCRDPAQTCTIDTGDFLQETDTITWIAGLSGVWSPWPFLGLTLNANYVYPRKTGVAAYAQNGVRLAGMLDFDAKPLLRWLPLGLSFAYSITAPIGSNGVTTTQNAGLGIFYTGRKALALGIEIDRQWGRMESDMVAESNVAWVIVRYYW
jgi:hypothetical protein